MKRASTKTALRSIERKLARRYPDIHCQVSWIARRVSEGEGQWKIEFFAKDREALTRCGVATTEQFELYETLSYCKRSSHPSSRDEFGNYLTVYTAIEKGGHFRVTTYIPDGDDSREYTKKLQAEVTRMLKPFVRGTWKPKVRA